MTETMTKHSAADRLRSTVESALREAVDRLPATVRRIAGYHLGWWDAHGGGGRAGGGKAVRPALVLLAAEATSQTAASAAGSPALPAAVAVELVHNFSLLHDDVMDGDATRRHRPTAWKVFGTGPAILAGDALLMLAFEVLSTSGHRRAVESCRMLGWAVAELLEGQAEDLAFERRDDVSLADCLRMARRKTGALMECSAGLGALFGGDSGEQVAGLREFGADLGLAFQFVDDLLGIWADERTGKPIHSDLRAGKMSLPVVAALRSGTAAGRQLAEAYRTGPRSEDRLARLAGWIEAAGGRDWCRAQADALLDRALQRLHTAVPPECATELAALARQLAHRDR
jgi:geranylgeranyl diphosphate synthase type I